ncbi:hypothetical protein LTSEWAN_6151 [Salmonella enterica subsp. enterica serovar Wandsworth str. A4-580]|uniref:Uncharacterized protein n=3 Tax=Salmonella enterica I TaxID=59201 RepID=E8X9X1_SALT4|nr:hypothetical protein STM474_4516 [Salmonella enterica subsp. enterica serovar Typhimurium str. ST4/74]AIE08293.1 hypothetical protein DC51_4437 [Salmonella enterica subsp. enterica serovar Typhimurium]AKD06377.1 hypothetical protein AX05_4440 [Salmonella enterica subsp. enterica serovar Typhimurium str. CDC 2011K-0870]EDZ16920.1 hypothetical protein SeI_A3978 [Salmonella enterica subsp. enterica serovar 4 [Salmonella enterica subsp. enterica serovar 4 [Salmonella enterica subsp. enterica sero
MCDFWVKSRRVEKLLYLSIQKRLFGENLNQLILALYMDQDT